MSETDDFFFGPSIVQLHNASHHQTDDTQEFADAIRQRFGERPDAGVLTARLIPPPLRLPSTPMERLSLTQPLHIAPVPPQLPSKYTAVPPGALSPWLDDTRTLVVDIRPHAAYSSAHIARAISLSVPSTLLKRPLFSLQRLSAMLPSRAARNRFSAWRSASRILVYDADSAAISDSSNIQGLLRKFRAEAPDANIELAWVQGGFQAVWTHRRDLVDTVPPTPETETETEDEESEEAQDTPQQLRVLRAHHLPRAAFALASTTQAPSRSGKWRNPGPPTPRSPRPRRTAAADAPAAGPVLHNALPATGAAPDTRHAFNPFFDAVRQNTELAHGITERIPLRLPRRVRRRIAELPFPWLRNIARRAAPASPPTHAPAAFSYGGIRGQRDSSEDENESSDSSSGTPPSASRVEEGTEALAMQFYRIELAEQRRLMGVMEHHTGKGKGKNGKGLFPFSITAGVEKGSKNRYRNIWPFEHARVRLHARGAREHDDYVNASYVQPIGTRRRYIATQGPLDATFGDFWTLVWQQNTHVIVMLTREVEGAMVKCGAYWRGGTYGALRVELLGCAAEGCRPGGCASTFNPAASGFNTTSPGFRAASTTTPPAPPPQLIKRTLRLTRGGQTRRVVQLQYLGWPDMNVPEDARGVLGLVWEVGREVERVRADVAHSGLAETADSDDSAVDGATGVLRRALKAGAGAAPVVLHCSAGVGRTGGFIAVDAVLDAVRREVREVFGGTGSGAEGSVRGAGSGGMRAVPEDRMEVDEGEGESEGRGMRTPMQVDSVEVEVEIEAGGDMGETRRWAERVADTRGAAFPTKAGSYPSTAVASAFPSTGSFPSTAPSFPSTGSFPSTTTSASYPSTAASSSYPSTAASTPFQFQVPTHRPTFSLTLPVAQRSLPESVSPPNHAQNPESKSASLPLKLGTSVSVSVRPFVLADRPLANSPLPDRPLANSPLPDRPRSLSPFGALAPKHRSMHSIDNVRASVNADEQAGAPDARHVDYMAPRALHGRAAAVPVRLSALEDPIWEVLQDMREQRMSLCQSLRQYVFVHAAIIEGALMVVDEERARAGAAWRVPRPQRPTLFLVPSDETQSTTSSTGKRLASPTELPKEDKKGEIVLSKRPSIKRKQASADEYAPPLPTFPPP
ncbi:hypothetical protein DFH09DRAFT_1456484 [Mycena vulgaris]|nr:hypothetical protein DFH09DRAFT_1456484 [Mycena vulgaris]